MRLGSESEECVSGQTRPGSGTPDEFAHESYDALIVDEIRRRLECAGIRVGRLAGQFPNRKRRTHRLAIAPRRP